MTEDVLLIKNPSAKSGKGKKNWKFFENYESIVTSSREQAIEVVKNTQKTVIAAVGGDGTINQCVNGVMKSDKKKKLAVLYSGTSPDFCRFHNIPTEPESAIDVLNNAHTEDVDVCKLIAQNGDEYWFSSSCNIGMGVKVAGTSNKIRWLFGDFLGTLIALIYAILSSNPFNAKIIINGATYEINNLYHLFVIKNNYIASGLKMNLNNSADNGIIFVAGIKKNGIKNLIKNVISLYNGNISDDILIGKGEEVYIETSPKQFIEFDGDPYYSITTPVKAECCRKALTIIK